MKFFFTFHSCNCFLTALTQHFLCPNFLGISEKDDKQRRVPCPFCKEVMIFRKAMLGRKLFPFSVILRQVGQVKLFGLASFFFFSYSHRDWAQTAHKLCGQSSETASLRISRQTGQVASASTLSSILPVKLWHHSDTCQTWNSTESRTTIFYWDGQQQQ